MKKIVVLKAEGDKVETVDYDGYRSIYAVTDGLIEHFHDEKIPTPLGNLNATLYCNEEGLLRGDLKTVNAIATLLYGQPIYGDVAVLKDLGDGEDTGFEYKETEENGVKEETICECWFVEDAFMLAINKNKNKIEALHKQYDDNKPEPFIKVTSMDDMEK